MMSVKGKVDMSHFFLGTCPVLSHILYPKQGNFDLVAGVGGADSGGWFLWQY